MCVWSHLLLVSSWNLAPKTTTMVENLEFGQYHNRARVHMIRSAGIKRLCGWWLWLANAMVTEGWPHSPATFCVQTMLPQTDSSISVWLSSGWTDQARTCFSLFFLDYQGDGWRVPNDLCLKVSDSDATSTFLERWEIFQPDALGAAVQK